MVWTIPDAGEGANDVQSIAFQEYLDVLVAGIQGVDCVLNGCAVTAQGSPDMNVAVASGSVLSDGVLRTVSSGNVAVTAADSTNPRLDLIVVDSSGAKVARTGTAAASPKPPARTANDVVLAVVYVSAGDTTIASNQIVDLRVVRADLDDTTASALIKRIGGSSGAAGRNITLQTLTSDASANSTTTPATVMTTTGLGVGTWLAEYDVIHQSGATTTGVGFQLGFSGTAGKMVVTDLFATSGGTAATAGQDQVASDTASLAESKAQRAFGAKLGATLSVDTANADMHRMLRCLFTVTVAGDLTLQHYSEVAASSQVMAGTMMRLTKVA